MSTVTDYTAKATENTLCGAPMSRYRLTHWMLDILKNLFSSPLNIPDERLRSLLFIQNGPNPDNCAALFDIAAPYSKDSRKAGTTPAILVSCGATSYPMPTINLMNGAYPTAINASGEYTDSAARQIGLSIALITESCQGTQLIADIVEDFLLTHRHELTRDAMVSRVDITGGSEVQEIPAGKAANAKALYQIVIGLTCIGGITWTNDTQGPVYRGVSIAPTIK